MIVIVDAVDAGSLDYHPDIDGMIDAIKEGSLEKMASKMGNVLQTVTESEYPIITEIKDIMLKMGALNSMMSGSGPTVFGIFKGKETAQAALDKLNATGLVKQGFVTTFAKETGIMEEEDF